LEGEFSDMLKLDDYVFANFAGENQDVNLYIGYYYTAAKAYAAHSPLVCYPSQGWQIDTHPKRSELAVGPHKIHYEEIVTSHGDQRELVLYWYQARLFTNTRTYQNKISMGYNKLVDNDQQHGFVRVSVPFKDDPYEKVKKAATDFIQAFYPHFVTYILQD
jgi:EpsI family protein